jgi:hypothetical protein
MKKINEFEINLAENRESNPYIDFILNIQNKFNKK